MLGILAIGPVMRIGPVTRIWPISRIGLVARIRILIIARIPGSRVGRIYERDRSARDASKQQETPPSLRRRMKETKKDCFHEKSPARTLTQH
jgi:hypothetical protein